MFVKQFISIWSIIIISLIINSCITSKAPKSWLDFDKNFYAYNALGAFVYVEFTEKGDKLEEYYTQEEFSKLGVNPNTIYELTVVGEFIGMQNDKLVILMQNQKIVKLNPDIISYIQIEILNRSPATPIILGTIGLLLTPLANGYFSALTIPLYFTSILIGGISESKRDVFYISNPKLPWLNELSKFSRFPQGINENIQLDSLRLRNIGNLENNTIIK